MTRALALHRRQKVVVVVAWSTYAAYYLARSNLAAVLPAIEADLGFSKSQLGTLSTGFFWAYAVGQLINGQLGDRLSPRWFVFAGMVGSITLSILFGTASAFLTLLIVWTVNGYFQATGWGPVVRILANWLTPDQSRRIAGVFGSSFVAGNAIALVVAGQLAAAFGWRSAFWVPAGVMALFAVLWVVTIRDAPADGLVVTASEPASPGNLSGAVRGIGTTLRRLWTLVLAAAGLGFCLVTLIIWMPTYFVEQGGVSLRTAATLAAFIPLAGIAGTIVTGWSIARWLPEREAIGLAMTLVLLAASLLIVQFLPVRLVVVTVALVWIGALVNGAASLMLTTMPLVMGRRGETSGTAGVLGFAFNVGAGASGAGVGILLDAFAWNAVFLVLFGAALGSALFVAATYAGRRSA